jgi:hypothetical protein
VHAPSADWHLTILRVDVGTYVQELVNAEKADLCREVKRSAAILQ